MQTATATCAACMGCGPTRWPHGVGACTVVSSSACVGPTAACARQIIPRRSSQPPTVHNGTTTCRMMIQTARMIASVCCLSTGEAMWWMMTCEASGLHGTYRLMTSCLSHMWFCMTGDDQACGCCNCIRAPAVYHQLACA